MKLNYTKFHFRRNFIYIIFIFLITNNLIAQTYPEDISLSDVVYSNYQPPVGAAPEYLESFTESLFGHTITRISDSEVFGTTNKNLRHHYALTQPWNSDGSLILLAGYPAAVLDGDTYELLYWSDIPSGSPKWSNTQPNIIYGVSENRFVSHDVTTNKRTILHTFSQFHNIEFGYNKGNQSFNDRYVALIGENGDEVTLITYDILEDKVMGILDLGDLSNRDLAWFSITPTGNYAMLAWRNDGKGQYEGYKRFDLDLSNETHFYDYTAHGDMGFDANGNEVLVKFGDESIRPDDYYINLIQIDNLDIRPLFYWTREEHGSSGIWGGHISLRNTDRPGWAYVTESCCTDHPVAPREIFAIKLDGSNTIERFAKHHSDNNKYGHSPMGVPNRDGTRVMFASNWDNAFGGENAPSYVLEVPQDGETPLINANAGDDITICDGDSTTLNASGGTTYSWNTGETTASIDVNPNSTTTYTVTVTNESQSDTDSVVVTVNELPNADAGNDVTIEQGQSTTLTALGGDSYQWSNGSINQSISVSPNDTTTYSVIVTTNSCSSTDDVIVTVTEAESVTANAGNDVTICNGDITTLIASGGTDYLWNTGDTTASIDVSPNIMTTYSVTVSIGSISDTDSVIVTVNDAPIANAGDDVSIIQGQSTTLTASGGDSYEWSNGATNQSISVSPNANTTYTVTVTTNNCSSTDSVDVMVEELVVANAGNDVTICEGNNATLTASGGTDYLWNTGEITASIEVNPEVSTTYSVMVSSGTQTDTDSVIVTVNEFSLANAGEDVTILPGESVTLTAADGGTSYQWNTGSTSQSITVSPNVTTNYSVTVYENTCSSEDSVLVTVEQSVIANAGNDVTICDGNSTVLIATGGTDYLWSTGETNSSIEVSPNASTEYSVTVSSGTQSDTDSVLVTVKPIPVADAGNDMTISQGENVTLTASGGSYYLWDNGSNTKKITVNPNVTTSYSVIVYKNGCSSTASVLVTVIETETVNANAGNDVTICEGSTTILTASGGTDYLWDTGETTISIEVSPNITTNYSVTVSNATQSDTDTVNVTVNESPIADAGNDITIVQGSSTTLTANGGTSYQWSNGEVTQNITVSPSITTNYSVTTYQNGCSSTDSVSVIVEDAVFANAGNDVTICEGNNTILTATGGTDYLWNTGETTASINVNPNISTTYTVTVSSGSQSDTDSVVVIVNALPIANAGNDVTINQGESVTLTAAEGGDFYIWSDGSISRSITVNPNVTTMYTVTVDKNSCSSIDSVLVTVTEVVTSEVIADAGRDVSICEGVNVTLTATGGINYLWNTGETTASIDVNPEITTTYSVTVSEGTESDTDSVNVNVKDMPIANAGNDVTIVLGQSVTLTAGGGSSYHWSNGATSQSIIVNPNISTNYLVTVSENGCSSSDSINVSVEEPVIANAGNDVTICEGSNTVLTATGGTDYLWNTGETTASIDVDPEVTTVYSVTVTSGSQSDIDSVVVTVNSLPIASAGNDVTISQGQSATLTASGGTSYLWSNGAATQSITVSPNITSNFSVRVYQNGCFSVDSATIIVEEDVIANAGNDIIICAGNNATLLATGGTNYLWSTGETTASIEVNPETTTTYSVTATSGSQSDTDSVIVSVNDIPIANAGNDITIVQGNSTTLSASGGNDYYWSNGSSTQSITVSPNVTTDYSVTVYQNECSSTSSVTVTVESNIVVNAGNDVIICEGSNTQLTASGGTSYLWNTGETTETIEVNPEITTTYSVTATSTSGLQFDTDSVVVIVNDLPEVNAGYNVTIVRGESTTLTASGGNYYSWSNGHSTQSITVSPNVTTEYIVTAYQNGCSNTDTVRVAVVDPITANAGSDVNICEGSSTVLTATGGTSYLWNTGETRASIEVNPEITTTYSVTVTLGSQSDTDSVIVNVIDFPIANAGSDITIERGLSATLTASGGNSYLWSNGSNSQTISVSPNQTTSYSVTVSNYDCSSIDEVIVNVIEPFIATISQDVTICSGESTTLIANGGIKYLWSTGETSESITVDPTVTSIYEVTVTNSDSEVDTANVIVTVNECDVVPIREENNTFELIVYPNPTKDIINVKLSGLDNVSSLQLIDLTGKTLINQAIQPMGNETINRTIDLSRFSKGIYMLTVFENGTRYTKKIILN